MNANAIRFRSGTLDSLRGLTLFSMIAYHLCWDLVYLRGLPWAWYNGFWAYIWQQSICCTFILLSGYCCQASRHPIRRGAISFFGGAAVSLATTLVTPEEPIRFGVLTFLGTAALLTIPLRPLLARIPPRLGLILSFSLFLLARDVNHGYLGFAWVPLLRLPRGLYSNLATAGLGFPPPAFASSDYFALLPWLFLFWTGFYLYRLRPEIPALPDIRLPGLHNVENYLAAVTALDGIVPYDVMKKTARSFATVLKLMDEYPNYHFMSSQPQLYYFLKERYPELYARLKERVKEKRSIAGLRAFDEKVILIAGGYDKHISFAPLAPEVVKHVKLLILCGATADAIEKALRENAREEDLPEIVRCADLAACVQTAYERAGTGDIVTLSPACAAFDCFTNFMERGKAFKKLVMALPE